MSPIVVVLHGFQFWAVSSLLLEIMLQWTSMNTYSDTYTFISGMEHFCMDLALAVGKSKAIDIHNVEKTKRKHRWTDLGPLLLQQEETSLLHAQGCSGGWVEEGNTEDRNLLVCFYCIYCFLEAGDNLVYKIVQKEAQTITRPIQLRYIDLPILNKGQKLRKKNFFWKTLTNGLPRSLYQLTFTLSMCMYVYVCIVYI